MIAQNHAALGQVSMKQGKRNHESTRPEQQLSSFLQAALAFAKGRASLEKLYGQERSTFFENYRKRKERAVQEAAEEVDPETEEKPLALYSCAARKIRRTVAMKDLAQKGVFYA